MNHYLETKPAQVNYWTKVASLVLTLEPLLLSWPKEPHPFIKDFNWTPTALKAKCLISGFCLNVSPPLLLPKLLPLSSFFWPTPLSLTNHLLLIPSAIWTGVSLYDLVIQD